MLGFFRELCPFSNFYPAEFTYDGIQYKSSEQLIQHKKALYCVDQTTTDKILATRTAISCKQLAYQIQNYNRQGWVDSAKELCHDAICGKFEQNPTLLRKLLLMGDKILVESSRDDIWGTGLLLFRWDCLNKSQWKGNGILSTLLMEIRGTLWCKNKEPRATYEVMEATQNLTF